MRVGLLQYENRHFIELSGRIVKVIKIEESYPTFTLCGYFLTGGFVFLSPKDLRDLTPLDKFLLEGYNA